MKFSINDISSKCNRIRKKLRIWLHLLDKTLMENFIFCAVEHETQSIVQRSIQKPVRHLRRIFWRK